MKVRILTHTAEPEKVVAMAAKNCYSASGMDELEDSLTPENVESFIKRLASMGHSSPLEHVTFTFAIEDVSRSLLAQITRHRIASYSVRSQRYVSENSFNYVIPPEIWPDNDLKSTFVDTMESIRESYVELREKLTARHVKHLEKTKPDLSDKARLSMAKKLANEDARYVLPNACSTEIVMTMNARSLLNFFELRCCTRAQWEIRALARRMLTLCKGVAPILFSNAGARCDIDGTCNEGPLSCGRHTQMAKRR